MIPHPTRLALAFMVILSASPLLAQGTLHKCVDAKGKVTYQDFPCGQAPRIGVPEAPATGAANPAAADSSSSPVMRQLDAAVRAAIAGRDLPRARGLAVTAQHWAWIAEAEKDQQQAQPATGRTQADLRAEKSASQECRDARRNYENESRSPEAIEKMKQLMYEACGMEPPADAGAGTGQTVIVNRPRIVPNTPPHRPDRPVARQPRTTEPAANAPRPPAKRMDE